MKTAGQLASEYLKRVLEQKAKRDEEKKNQKQAEEKKP